MGTIYRDQHIDILRGIGILFVVLSHTSFLPIQQLTIPFISNVMLPIFFIVGGILLRRNSTSPSTSYAAHKTYLLFQQYFLVAIVTASIWILLQQAYGHPFDIVELITSLLTARRLQFNGPLWFLPAYAITILLSSYVLYFYRRGGIYRILSLSFLLLCLMLSTLTRPDVYIWSIGLALLCVPFFVIGFALWLYSRYLSTRTTFAALLIYMYVCFTNGTVDLNQGIIGNPWLFYLGGISGSIALYGIAQWLSRFQVKLSTLLATMGKYSFSILISHWVIMQWITFVLYQSKVIESLNGAIGLASFWYHIDNPYVFTIIEIPLLVLYTAVPILLSLMMTKPFGKPNQILLDHEK